MLKLTTENLVAQWGPYQHIMVVIINTLILKSRGSPYSDGDVEGTDGSANVHSALFRLVYWLNNDYQPLVNILVMAKLKRC